MRQTVCICRWPRSRFAQPGLAARRVRTSARVRKSRRNGGGLTFGGGLSNQPRSWCAMKGPALWSSSNERPSAKRSAAYGMKRSPKAPAERPPRKKGVPETSQQAVDRDHFYRCPACGKLVDGRDREAMALHHRHVLFPQPFDLRRKGSAK